MTAKKSMLATGAFLLMAFAGFSQSKKDYYEAIRRSLLAEMHFEPKTADKVITVLESHDHNMDRMAAEFKEEEKEIKEGRKAAPHEDLRDEKEEKYKELMADRSNRLRAFLSPDQCAQVDYADMRARNWYWRAVEASKTGKEKR